MSNKKMAQSTIEFTFVMIAILFLIYGMVQVFRWAGMDLAQRRWSQDHSMTVYSGNLSLEGRLAPIMQLNGDYYQATHIDAVYNGSITDDGQ